MKRGRPPKLDSFAIRAEEFTGIKGLSGKIRFVATCTRCHTSYNTYLENERHKKNPWTCSCIWRAPNTKDVREKKRIAQLSRDNTIRKKYNGGWKHTEEALKKMRGRIVSDSVRKGMSERTSARVLSGLTYSYCKSGNYTRHDGTVEFFRSSYEERRMKFLDAEPRVKTWTSKHGIKIPYEGRNYIPDFLVVTVEGDVFCEEIKGWVQNKSEFEAKRKAAEMFCVSRGWIYRVLWETDLEML